LVFFGVVACACAPCVVFGLCAAAWCVPGLCDAVVWCVDGLCVVLVPEVVAEAPDAASAAAGNARPKAASRERREVFTVGLHIGAGCQGARAVSELSRAHAPNE